MSLLPRMPWCGVELLAETWDKIKETRGREGRKKPPVGIDGVTSEIFDSQLPQSLEEISRLLAQVERDGSRATRYRFAPFRRKTISSEPGKRREICIPRIRDQIVLRAIADLVLEQVKKAHPQFLNTSPRRAVKKVIAAREQGYRHVLRTDIANYYPSIPHEPLLASIKKLDLDEKALELISLALVTPLRDTRLGKQADIIPERGVPIGLSLSTVLAEYYLASLTKGFCQPGMELVRYVDDLALLATDGEAIQSGGKQLIEAIGKRELSLSKSKTIQGDFAQGFEFLGFTFQDDRVLIAEAKSLKWPRVYQGIARRFIERMNNTPAETETLQHLKDMVHEINREISGSCGMQVPYYSLADDLTPFRTLDRQIREVIGGVFRRQGQSMDGPLRIESAYSWAWKYKRGHDEALANAKDRFPRIEVDSASNAP